MALFGICRLIHSLSLSRKKSDAQLSRRKVLSIIASVFDPLGLVSPFVLQGKRILQDMCLVGLSWDDTLPPDLENRFQKWLSHVPSLQDLQVPRCLKPVGFDVSKCELHHFCDASSVGYGVCSYARLLDSSGTPSISLIFAKSRVAPVKPVTIPRLELSSAVLAVRIAIMLDKELQYSSISHFFYTDSKVIYLIRLKGSMYSLPTVLGSFKQILQQISGVISTER